MNTVVQVRDKKFALYISEEKIKTRVAEVAAQIDEDLRKKNPLFLVLLNGSFVFAADLLRSINFPCEISFVKMSSYEGTSSPGKVKQLIGLNENVTGRTIVIVEDIIESGTTMKALLHMLGEKQPKEVFITSLFVKPGCLKVDLKIDYRCFDIEDDFIVGYGLDYNQEGRNLPHIYQVIE
jgi:hypoxanthine phosphoribosyltransferase